MKHETPSCVPKSLKSGISLKPMRSSTVRTCRKNLDLLKLLRQKFILFYNNITIREFTCKISNVIQYADTEICVLYRIFIFKIISYKTIILEVAQHSGKISRNAGQILEIKITLFLRTCLHNCISMALNYVYLTFMA